MKTWNQTIHIYLVVCAEFFAIGCECQQTVCSVNQAANL